MTFWEVDVLGDDSLEVDILGVDILRLHVYLTHSPVRVRAIKYKVQSNLGICILQVCVYIGTQTTIFIQHWPYEYTERHIQFPISREPRVNMLSRLTSPLPIKDNPGEVELKL